MRTKLRLDLKALPDTDGWGEYVEHMETLRGLSEASRTRRLGYLASVLAVATAAVLLAAAGLYATKATADLRTQARNQREQRAQAAYERGVFFSRRRRYEDAVRQLRAAIELRPRAAFYNELGEAYLGLRARGQAIAQFDKALELEPGNVRALSKKGWALAADGKYVASRRLLEEAMRRSRSANDRILVLGDRGWASIQESTTKDAVKERAEKERLLQGAIRDLKDAIELLQSSAGAAEHRKPEREVFESDYHNNLAWAYIELGRLSESGSSERRHAFGSAVGACQQAVSLNPDFSWAYHNLGDAYWGLDDLESAVAAYSRSIDADPVNAWSFQNRGKAYEQMARESRDPDRAKRLEKRSKSDLEEARRLGITIQE